MSFVYAVRKGRRVRTYIGYCDSVCRAVVEIWPGVVVLGYMTVLLKSHSYGGACLHYDSTDQRDTTMPEHGRFVVRVED